MNWLTGEEIPYPQAKIMASGQFVVNEYNNAIADQIDLAHALHMDLYWSIHASVRLFPSAVEGTFP